VLVHSRALERDMRDEMRFHVDMEADRLERAQGLPPAEARRQALVRFGGVEAAKEAGRDARGRQWLDAAALDARLAVRMLWKYPGLTLVGGFAMAVAVAVGAVAFEILGQVLTPTLPFDPDGRIVSVSLYTRSPETDPLALVRGDIALRSFDAIGAYRTVSHNLAAPGALAETITLAEMTASGFTLAGVPPALGRYVEPHDASPTAPPVVVVGHRAWVTRFGSDPALVGRAIVLSGVPHEVIGVMPEGFEFPIDHQFWLPFRPSSVTASDPNGPEINLFARLAPRTTAFEATVELEALIAAARPPGASAGPSPEVSPYTLHSFDLSDPGIAQLVRGVQFSTWILIFAVAVNLAIVLYARTVRRVGEIAVRSALGASRRRIVVQLFVEALALTASGAIVGLTAAAFSLRQLHAFAHSFAGVPFWLDFQLSIATMVGVGVLAVLSALIMGVVPGLRATGRQLHAELHELRGAGPRLGRIWSTLVVGQIAAAVAILPAAVYMAWEVSRMHATDLGFAVDRFSFVRVHLPSEGGAAANDRIRDRHLRLMNRLAAEPGVDAVTFSASVPGIGPGAVIEFAPDVRATPSLWVVSRFRVAPDLLDVYDAQLLAGRLLGPADVSTDAVVVNETFVAWLADRADAVGTRFRYLSMAGQPVVNARWHQIVGVVGDFPRVPSRLALDTPAATYHAVAIGSINPMAVTLRYTEGAPPVLAARARAIAANVDQALQIPRAMPLPELYSQFFQLWAYVSWALTGVTASALLLSAAGLYAMMSFIVAQREREIGLRMALGASPRRLLFTIFRRAVRQLAAGIAIGSLLSWSVLAIAGFEPGEAVGLVAAVAVVTAGIGAIAAVGPARRSLRIPAAEALRAERA
jgi:predicted permease